MPISDEKLGDILDAVAGRTPAPGASAMAALQVAHAAALLGMVARYSTGGSLAQQRAALDNIVGDADQLRQIALDLADADADAFATLTSAYKLPHATTAEQASRDAALARALASAAWPTIQVIGLAEIIVSLSEAMAALGNRNVACEVAAAAEIARSAVAVARLNIEVSLADIADEEVSLRMISEVGKAEDVIARAKVVAATVRERIRG